MSSSFVTERAEITDVDSQAPPSGCLVLSCVIISILPKLSENSFLQLKVRMSVICEDEDALKGLHEFLTYMWLGQWLRALNALAEDPGSVPRRHVCLTTTCNFSS